MLLLWVMSQQLPTKYIFYLVWWSHDILMPRQCERQFADDVFKCIFLMEIVELWLKFHWNLFPMVKLIVCQHWFRKWLGTTQVTSHYLNQWWPRLLTHIWVTRPQWINNDQLLGWGYVCSYNVYRKTSSISRTKSQNLNVSCLLLLWSLPNPLKPGAKLRMKM